MPQLEFSRRFLKDVKRWKKSGQSMDKLDAFVRLVAQTWPPPVQYEPHLLQGECSGVWDVHLRQNWVLLLHYHHGTVRFLRMGTHAELGL
jgi:addiction module RelE/StbE family toxin